MQEYAGIILTIAFPLLFIGVSLVLNILCKGNKLSTIYKTSRKPYGTKWAWQSGSIGLVNFRNCLTIYVNNEGMFLNILPPFGIVCKNLFIKWDEISNVRREKMLFFKYISFDVGIPKITRMDLPEKIFKDTPVMQMLGESI